MMKVPNIIADRNFAKLAKGTALTVYLMTGVKAVVRPAFIMGDKKNDPETKKYTAAKELLYQTLCLGIAIAILPFFEMGGFKLAQKKLNAIKGLSKNITKIEDVEGFAKLKGLSWFKQTKAFQKLYLEKSFPKKEVDLTDKEKTAEHAMHLVNGGVELGSFVGSILGLTIIAPLISHEILHPIMRAFGMDKKELANPALEKLQQPILSEAYHKIDAKG